MSSDPPSPEVSTPKRSADKGAGDLHPSPHPPHTPSSPGSDPTADPSTRRRGDLVRRALHEMRIASPSDNARILDLMGDTPMKGSLAIATRRDPDFFALYRLQRGQQQLWIRSEDGDEQKPLSAMAGFLTREGFLDDDIQTVGYLGDLRLRGFARSHLAFPQVYAHLFRETVEATGCETFLTGIIADNEAALRALVMPAKKRRGQPHYSLVRRFEMANVHFLRSPTRRQRTPPPGYSIQRGGDVDVDAVAAFLHADHQHRPFGYRFDDGELQHRLDHWPGFDLQHTFVVRDQNGDIVATTTCWDTAAVKRYRVLHYGGQMVWVKRALQLTAKVTGTSPLPNVGDDFRYFYLSNLSVRDDDPKIFQILVDAIYTAYADAGFHFFAFPLYEGDTLAAGCRGYYVRRMPFHLYGVTAADVARDAWPSGRPGFEMALA